MQRDAVLVTGGNSGVGFECARELARKGWHVIIASRDRAASARAVECICQESGRDAAAELGLDLGSMESVRRFADEFKTMDVSLRALVFNAGLQVNGQRRLSPDGFEMSFAANHLGHFLLAHLLVDRLRAPARVVIVSSGVHDSARWTGMPKPAFVDFATLATTGGSPIDRFDGQLAYVNSKLCNLWFAYELGRRLKAAGLSTDQRPITVNAFDPGLVPGSGLARDYPAPLRFLWMRVLPVIARMVTSVVPMVSTATKSGRALARLVLDPALGSVSGAYFPSHTRWVAESSSSDSYDLGQARALWEASVRMTGVGPAESSLAISTGPVATTPATNFTAEAPLTGPIGEAI